jgi:ATP-dependent DNA helicase RecQ
LEQDDIISFNEMIFKPSTVLVIANRDDLVEFEKIHPLLEPLIKGLLRSYEGIFDFPAMINEAQLAKFLKQDIVYVKEGLKQLNHYGMIMYSPQNEKPQVTLLKNRMYADSYAVNTSAHLERKKNFEQRVAAMLGYVKNITGCRSKIIGSYFNAPIANDCGICDNCINQKALIISAEEFENIAAGIFQLIKNNPLPMKEIQQHLRSVKKEKLWKVINFLLAENKIAATKDGNIFI